MSEESMVAELFAAFMRPGETKSSVARMSLTEIEYIVRSRRKSEKVPEDLRDLPLPDTKIALLIQDHAQGSSAAAHPERLLMGIFDRQRILFEQQKTQEQYLKRINTVVQLWGVLLILGIIGWCLFALLGGSPFLP